MRKYVTAGSVIVSAVLLAACGQAQSDERVDRRDRAEEIRGGEERGSGRGREEEATRDEFRRARSPSSNERPVSASDATNQNFVMRNNTGQTIMRVFVSPVTSNNWEEDVLGRDVLPDRQTVRINFDRSEDECHWDIKVDLEDGSSREQRNMNLCRLAEVEVTG